jgi:hypothetical protein
MQRPRCFSSVAPSQKDRENELALNESVYEESFELERSFESLNMPQHTLPMQQITNPESKFK